MTATMSSSLDLDRRLAQALCEHPRQHNNRYTASARDGLLEILFRSATNDRPDYLQQLFPQGFPASFRLQDAQGVQENIEYSAAAKGHPCGHIFKPGEATYHCGTCTDDSTAVLCSRCFASSDHEGHQYQISISAGNSGCCDCGDDEAWKRPVKCAIHTQTDGWTSTDEHVSPLPTDLQQAIRTTVARALDYFCDVISCSPENQRLPKSIDSVTQDELNSRLSPDRYVTGDEIETNPEYALIIWNDEKHTVREVLSQVARACRERESFGLKKAEEANDFGRSVVRHSRDLKELTRMAKIIEEIKITVTIRSSRDTFREQMCGTIVDWLSDVAGCTLAGDAHILRRIICEEMLQLWRVGSKAWNAKVGDEGLDDHAEEEERELRKSLRLRLFDPVQFALQRAMAVDIVESDSDSDADNDPTEMAEVDDDDDDDDDADDELLDDDDDQRVGHTFLQTSTFEEADTEVTDDADEMDTDGDGDADFVDVAERMDTDRASPAPPPPSPPPNAEANTQNDQEAQAPAPAPPPAPDSSVNYLNIPKTPTSAPRPHRSDAPAYWQTFTLQERQRQPDSFPVYEDLSKNIRVDSLILFDLRLWKLARTNIRDLFISTLVNIPQFKRLLGLRFAALYTTLAQLYLVADREPDHSIINLSLQLLTTPSITEEVIERGNFFTHLMAILYTFLTTRQVGLPRDVDPDATLGFDAGSVANRRLYHFFSDLRYFLASSYVQTQARNQRQYLHQFLDLAKLSQGICPNVRAVGDHVEYETDAWISASLLTRDINKLCRQFAEAYQVSAEGNISALQPTCIAISEATTIATINSLGLEHKRFDQSEIKDFIRFHTVGPFAGTPGPGFRVVDFNVADSSISFHHPLHYVLSWLLENAKGSEESIAALRDGAQTFLRSLHESNQAPQKDHRAKLALDTVDDALLALFDYPLRVCAWLAQMRANLWVRNGMSLRHQMVQYKSVAHRDVGHHRDLFMLQAALVSCDPSRVLASMLDRFMLAGWLENGFVPLSICDEGQMLDLAEDFTYLLINLLSDRDALISDRENPQSQLFAVRKDIAHTLCFKPLSYSDLCARLTERAQEHENLQEVLDTMTKYRPPEGLHDSGLFELKEEYLQELDPYNSHFTKNQRDEAENIYKKWMAKKLKKDPEDIVLEPKLRPIPSPAYQNLCAVVHTPLFASVIFNCLMYVAWPHKHKSGLSATRIEAFLQIVLQLALIATMEDHSAEVENPGRGSFIQNAMNLAGLHHEGASTTTIVAALHAIWSLEEFTSCRSKIRHILRLFNQKRPQEFLSATRDLEFPSGRFDTASPSNVESDIEAKKKLSMERKARVMAQFQQQQQSFMDKQGMLDWGEEDLDSPEEELPKSTEIRHWKYPAGLCIQCREDTSDSRLYGTFAMVSDAHVLRQTDITDDDFIGEVVSTPESLDRSCEDRRPFGVSGSNHEKVNRLMADGREVTFDRQGLGKGWPKNCTMSGPVSTSCGHIMHFTCFENYFQSLSRRHSQQVARNHPERIVLKEFVCPLCKALSNAFLPIIWKHTKQSYPAGLAVSRDFDTFLDEHLASNNSLLLSEESFEIESTRVHSETLNEFSNVSMAPALARWQEGELNISPTSPAWAENPELAAFAELAGIYGRLRESLNLVSRTRQTTNVPHKQLYNHHFSLVNVLANSIAAVEIGYRGRDSEFGTSLLTTIPQQTLSHLQILSATLRAYAATVGLTVRESTDAQYQEICARVQCQLNGMRVSNIGNAPDPVLPLLYVDSFQFLVQSSMILCPLLGWELHHVLRLCLTMEMLRVILMCMMDPEAMLRVAESVTIGASPQPTTPVWDQTEIYSVQSIVRWMQEQLVVGGMATDTQMKFTQAVQDGSGRLALTLFRLCKSYSLAFLRKAAVFFHVAHGIDFPTAAGSEASLSELDRLLHLLQMPRISEVLVVFDEYHGRSTLKERATLWVADFLKWRSEQMFADASAIPRIKLLHPAPLELVGLPKHFDVLMEESQRRRCPTTGKEVSEPALCLFCGEIFCSQAVCCQTDDQRGGCNTHVEKCSSPVGMFLFIRKCHVVLLHVVKNPRLLDLGEDRSGIAQYAAGTLPHGSFFPAPYLTKHGETDSGLRSKHQLILNQKRYDKLLRDTWLMTNGSVWSTIARKLESEVNAGGWETL